MGGCPSLRQNVLSNQVCAGRVSAPEDDERLPIGIVVRSYSPQTLRSFASRVGRGALDVNVRGPRAGGVPNAGRLVTLFQWKPARRAGAGPTATSPSVLTAARRWPRLRPCGSCVRPS